VSALHRIAAMACAVVLLAGCGGPGVATPAASTAATTPTAAAATAGPTEAATSAPTGAPTPTAVASTGAFALAASVWWSGFEIAVRGGLVDMAKRTLVIDATFKNTGTQASELRNLSDWTAVSWNSQAFPGFVTSGLVAAGATAHAQISVAIPTAFDLTAATLTFGKSDEHRAIVPLNGAEATSDLPSRLHLTGKITMGKYVTYTVTSAWIVPASCSGYPDRIKYGPLKANLLSIVVFGTAASTDSTNYRQIDRGYLVLPDGSKVASVPQMSLSLPLNTSFPNEAMCFAVTPPFPGGYKIGMHEYRSNATGTLAIDLT
jgi:hypothetical protein